MHNLGTPSAAPLGGQQGAYPGLTRSASIGALSSSAAQPFGASSGLPPFSATPLALNSSHSVGSSPVLKAGPRTMILFLGLEFFFFLFVGLFGGDGVCIVPAPEESMNRCFAGIVAAAH